MDRSLKLKRKLDVKEEPVVVVQKEPLRIKGLQGKSCWYCTLNVGEHPIGLPVKQRKAVSYKRFFTEEKKVEIFRMEETAMDGFMLEGSFCSPSCVLAYIINANAEDVIRFKDARSNLYVLTNLADIVPSPDFKLLEKFGGPLSEEAYRELKGKNKVLIRYSEYDSPMSVVYCES